MNGRLDIIIVNWNSGDQLYKCLSSIELTEKENFTLNKVIVVDNASTDNSIEGLENINIPLQVIRNTSNRGFAAACNQGTKNSKSDYILFLNPDTELYKNSLSDALKFMQKPENSNFSICGIQLLDNYGKVSRTCARFPTTKIFASKMLLLNKLFPKIFPSHKMSEWDHCNTQEVDQVIGAFFLIRRKLFEQLGGFDERYFVYFEEVDLSYRAYKLGYKNIYLASVQAYHKGGGTSERVKATRLFYSLRSRILYGFKHFNPLSAWMLFFATILIEPFSRLILAVLHHSFKEAKETIQGYLMLIKDLPNIVRKIKNEDTISTKIS